MLNTYKLVISTAILSSLFIQSALAADWTENITIKGFASAVYQKTDDPVYFNGDCKRTFTGMMQNTCVDSGQIGTVNGVTTADGGVNDDGSFRRTRVGLNVNASINENTTVLTQFLVTEESNEYTMILDWGFINIALDEKHSIRAGKIKMPIGLVNEYQNVGFATPWIEAPQLFYTTQFNGPNATRESYRGLSYLYQTYIDDWSLSSDIFWGNVALEGMSLSNMMGITLKAEWDESIYMQISNFSGEMNTKPRMAAMFGNDHKVSTIGIGGDVNSYIFYAEYAFVDMEMDMQETTTWYASGGYQFNDITFMLTHQNMDKGVDVPDAMKNAQTIDSISIRYDFAINTALKLEFSQINTDLGVGLFAAGASSDTKPNDSVNMFGMAIEVLF